MSDAWERWKPLPDLGPTVEQRIGTTIAHLNDDEREEMLRTVCRTVYAYEHTRDADYLIQLAHQVRITIQLRNSDEYMRSLRR